MGISELQRRPLMAILAGFDVHRAQITFDALNTETGEVLRGRFRADRDAVGEWMAQFFGEHVEVAVEACTGWLFVYEALAGAGAVVHLAEPAETSALRGKKRHAKTDRADARWLRTLLVEGRLPEAGIALAQVREWRTRPGWARRSSTSARAGCSASRRRCLNTASSMSPTSCCGPTGAHSLARSRCRPRPCSGSRSPWRSSMRSIVSWCGSSARSLAWRAAKP